ncbi:LacI family DNA-binding transcriptional regulator [Pectinatus haikarae]|uniref:LacI family transcriptional regulator n=1 Tax=Pectinatus haikarae TaxID=349096 RepID=A0ABT9Y5M6_9FIRM|nr:LacI family DNA-binding transcriptional regulator [Pectinatus haikarae]MDQ0203132.1 LacI family transcriptional regulator [Pectinatus haikarae]
MKSTTIIDVAKHAGVSVATVSRVVNGNYPVKEETKKRVLDAIKELHYVQNIQARELNTRQSTTIGVVVPSLFNMFFAEVFDGIEEYIKHYNYSMLITCAKDNPLKEKQCMQELLSRNVCGIINISPNTYAVEASFYDQISARVPTVFINSYVKRPGISYVSNDEASGTKLALEHLIGLGHRHILFIRGMSSDSYEIKEEIYRKMMTEYKVKPYVLNIGEGNVEKTVDNTLAKVMMAIKSGRKITAIFACNDLMATGAINGCYRLGIKVPEDISIIGFDNISISRFIEPKLTTIDQNMSLLGQSATALLMEKIESNNTVSDEIILENTLIKRNTTAPVKR